MNTDRREYQGESNIQLYRPRHLLTRVRSASSAPLPDGFCDTYEQAILTNSRPKELLGRPSRYLPPVLLENPRASSFSKWRERAAGEMPVASRSPPNAKAFPFNARTILMRRSWVKAGDCRMTVLKNMGFLWHVLIASSKSGAESIPRFASAR